MLYLQMLAVATMGLMALAELPSLFTSDSFGEFVLELAITSTALTASAWLALTFWVLA